MNAQAALRLANGHDARFLIHENAANLSGSGIFLGRSWVSGVGDVRTDLRAAALGKANPADAQEQHRPGCRLRHRAPDCDGRNRQGSISEERIDQFKRSREEARIAGIAGKQGRGIELGEPEVGSGNAQAGEYSVAETDRRRFAGDAAKRAVDIIESD